MLPVETAPDTVERSRRGQRYEERDQILDFLVGLAEQPEDAPAVSVSLILGRR